MKHTKLWKYISEKERQRTQIKTIREIHVNENTKLSNMQMKRYEIENYLSNRKLN